ncbi:MAG TPA: UDP-3-O-(3-hydroxymyristoyl)glucosamine N-acyltransferase, partial [Pirellulaceae bacterium]|nr:UDP-3-O-(3-hydroxymyristoyl)glucosamine N-acyltransferase [Pirellulaceae bacterium]
MSLALSDIARLVEGRLTGDGDLLITGAATLAVAGPGDVTLADDPKYAAMLSRCGASAVIVPSSFQPTDRPTVTVANVHQAFSRIVELFYPPRKTSRPGISPAACIDASARLADDVEVHPQVFIGADVEIGAGCLIHSGVRILDGCKIGEHCTLFPNAVLYENTVVGNRVIIHAGAVLGAYGFGYSLAQGKHKLCAQLGFVEIGDDVEIGAATTIDRGTYGPTVVGEGTKLDNLVQIGHNCRLGKHNLICSQVGIAGSCSTGDYVVMAGQVGIADHLHMADRSVLGAKGGVMFDTEPGKRYIGLPAVEEREAFRNAALVRQLPQMKKQIHELQRQ